MPLAVTWAIISVVGTERRSGRYCPLGWDCLNRQSAAQSAAAVSVYALQPARGGGQAPALQGPSCRIGPGAQFRLHINPTITYANIQLTNDTGAWPQLTTPLNRSPLSEHRYLKPLVLFLTIFFLNATLGAPGRTLFPVYVEKVLGGSPILTSTLFSVQNVVRIVVLFGSGLLADRVGAKYILLLGMTAVSIGGLMFMVSDTRLLVLLALLYGALFTLRTTSLPRLSRSGCAVGKYGLDGGALLYRADYWQRAGQLGSRPNCPISLAFAPWAS